MRYQLERCEEEIGLLSRRIVVLLISRQVAYAHVDELGRFFRMRHVGHVAGIHFPR